MAKKKTGKEKNISFFKMEQELWMKVSGSVRGRLNIDVDCIDIFDKKDISFSNAEFTGYSKELFGLKVDTHYKTLELNVFSIKQRVCPKLSVLPAICSFKKGFRYFLSNKTLFIFTK
jgi:uncharacterized protein (UPF0276 family)